MSLSPENKALIERETNATRARWWADRSGIAPELNRLLDAARQEGARGGEPVALSDDQIRHLVGRFLAWKLPTNFNPDGGIAFKAEFNENTPWPMKHEPMGTNLFDALQAEQMVRYMMVDLPSSGANQIGAAEAEVGRYIYRRIEALMGAKPNTVEGAELTYLSEITERVEEYGEDACAGHTLGSFLASPAEPSGWRPIESAPKDGTQVDLWCRAPGDLKIAQNGEILRLIEIELEGEKWEVVGSLACADAAPAHGGGG